MNIDVTSGIPFLLEGNDVTQGVIGKSKIKRITRLELLPSVDPRLTSISNVIYFQCVIYV